MLEAADKHLCTSLILDAAAVATFIFHPRWWATRENLLSLSYFLLRSPREMKHNSQNMN